MHEASLMAGLVRKALDVAKERGGGRIVRLNVRLGALSHFSPDHFRDHFAIAAHGTIAEGAELSITTSDDIASSHAQEVLLQEIVVEAPSVENV